MEGFKCHCDNIKLYSDTNRQPVLRIEDWSNMFAPSGKCQHSCGNVLHSWRRSNSQIGSCSNPRLHRVITDLDVELACSRYPFPVTMTNSVLSLFSFNILSDIHFLTAIIQHQLGSPAPFKRNNVSIISVKFTYYHRW